MKQASATFSALSSVRITPNVIVSSAAHHQVEVNAFDAGSFLLS
jgi:hypothetical protein